MRVAACGVCRTDLHVVEGDLPSRRCPLVPGHQIVGTVEALGEGVRDFALGRSRRRALAGRHGRDAAPIAERAARTSATRRRSPATSATAATRSTRSRAPTSRCRLPDDYPDVQAAPLLCAGLIGYRALRLAEVEAAARAAGGSGLYGFGSSAHIVIQVARHLGHEVYVVHARRAAGGASRASSARPGPAVGEERAAGRARQRDHLRARGRAGAASRCGRAQGRGGRVRGHPHDRRSRSSTTTCCGASAICAASRT